MIEAGCGDGSLLAELAAREFAPALWGAEVAEAPAAIARGRGIPGLEEICVFDGVRLPYPDGRFDLGVCSHVIEHAADPGALLAELRRCCAAAVVEVPLEANLSARRASRQALSEEIGHVRALDRGAFAALASGAGWRIAADMTDPLPFAVTAFFAEGTRARAAAAVKHAVRRGLHAASPALAARTFTVHYAALLLPA